MLDCGTHSVENNQFQVLQHHHTHLSHPDFPQAHKTTDTPQLNVISDWIDTLDHWLFPQNFLIVDGWD